MAGSDAGVVTIVIVNWNTAELVLRCLASIYEDDLLDRFEVVVIDNASSDDSVQMLRRGFPAITIIENSVNEGFARAVNQGFYVSNGRYVLLLNSDTEVRRGAIEACRAHLEKHRDIGAVGCRIEGPDGSPQNSVFRYPSIRRVLSTTFWLAQAFPQSKFFNYDRYGMAFPDSPTSVDVVMGSFLMVRRADHGSELLDDGYFMYSEEADLCRRLQRQGLGVVFLPEPSIVHIRGGSSRTAPQRAWSDEAKKRALLRYLRKWDGATIAYLANIIMLIGLVPRVPAWAVGDLAAWIGGGTPGRILKARSFRFHVRCLLRPSLMAQRFSGPPV